MYTLEDYCENKQNVYLTVSSIWVHASPSKCAIRYIEVYTLKIYLGSLAQHLLELTAYWLDNQLKNWLIEIEL